MPTRRLFRDEAHHLHFPFRGVHSGPGKIMALLSGRKGIVHDDKASPILDLSGTGQSGSVFFLKTRGIPRRPSISLDRHADINFVKIRRTT